MKNLIQLLVRSIGSRNSSTTKKILSLLAIVVVVVFLSGSDTNTIQEPEVEVVGQGAQYIVRSVVDGDTIKVQTADGVKTVRIIGINTPETVDPRRPVECFGVEASNHAKKILTGKEVQLVVDPTQDSTDRYGRLLRYVTIDGQDFGSEMISGGYAYEYTYDVPHEKQSQYRKLQKIARDAGVGLWGDKCAGSRK